jgi:WD40 repeat protein/MinD-like ATPase involved in chromosome partitioning or flagellar assembly
MKSGTIVTFYSYKGGVGRSFALANVAVTLAKWGFKVLCIDCDLEAPGLAFYFQAWTPEPTHGFVQYVTEFCRGVREDWKSYTYTVEVPGTEARLALMPAGSKHDQYVDLLRDINWKILFSERHFGALIEELREIWVQEYDFVILDSRTGVSDIGGVCTVHFPDILVFFFTANRQSFEGVTAAVRGIKAARQLLEGPRLGLLSLPVVSRFEPGTEYDASSRWMQIFTENLVEFYEPWLPGEGQPPEQVIRTLIQRTTLPYFAKWSFGEELPVLTESNTGSTQLISFYLETLSAILALRFENSQLLFHSAEQYIQAAKRQGIRLSRPQYDVFLTMPRGESEFGESLAHTLRLNGIKVFNATVSFARPTPKPEEVEVALDVSKAFVFVASKEQDSEAENSLNQFLRRNLDDQAGRRVIPVLLGVAESALPQAIRRQRFLNAREGIAVLAARIRGELDMNRDLSLEQRLVGHDDVILRVAWHPRGDLLSTSSVDCTAKVWDVNTGHLLSTLKGHNYGVNRAVWSPTGRFLATCSYDRTLRIWSTNDWKCVRVIDKPHSEDIPSLSWSPCDGFLASGTVDGMIFIWEANSWKLLASIKTKSEAINQICWLRDSTKIYGACADGSIGVWSVTSGERERRIVAHRADVLDISISPGEDLVASCSFDRSVKIWRLESWDNIVTLKAHNDIVRSVSFSMDARYLASNALDGWVCIWDCATWEPKIFLEESVANYWPCSVAFAPTDQRLATLGEEDRIVRIWRLKPGHNLPNV